MWGGWCCRVSPGVFLVLPTEGISPTFCLETKQGRLIQKLQAIQQQVQPRDFESEIHKLHNELRSYPTVRFFCWSFFLVSHRKKLTPLFDWFPVGISSQRKYTSQWSIIIWEPETNWRRPEETKLRLYIWSPMITLKERMMSMCFGTLWEDVHCQYLMGCLMPWCPTWLTHCFVQVLVPKNGLVFFQVPWCFL